MFQFRGSSSLLLFNNNMFQGYYLKFGSHFSWPWNLAGALLTLKGSGSKPQGNLDNLRRSICIVDDDTRCQGNPKKTISILSWNWQLYKQRTDHQDVYTHRVLTTTTKYPQNTDKYQQNTDKYWQDGQEIIWWWFFVLKKCLKTPVFCLCFGCVFAHPGLTVRLLDSKSWSAPLMSLTSPEPSSLLSKLSF